MSQQSDRAYFGPYMLVRPLGRHRLADRFLALHVRRQSSHIVYRFEPCRDRAERRRFLSAFETLGSLRQAHLLAVEQFSFGSQARGWMVSPYPGNQDGLVTLRALLDLKGGRMGPFEAERAMTQLLEAAAFAQDRGLAHGAISSGDVLVDRHGSLLIEAYGLERMLAGDDAGEDDEVRLETDSIVRLGYECLTGLEAGDAPLPPSRAVRRLEKRWDAWFERAFDPIGGFESAGQALAALQTIDQPSEAAVGASRSPVKVMLDRIRPASTRTSAGEGEAG